MKPALQLRQSQHLTLTPQLQQSIKLLQLSTLEMNQEVARLLEENPLLERDDDDASIYSYEATAIHRRLRPPQAMTQATKSRRKPTTKNGGKFPFPAASSPDDEDEPHAEIIASSPSLREHLILQLSLNQMDDRRQAA